MIKITVSASEAWDESKQEFITTKEQTLELEHSLVSISKWESKWCKPFVSSNKTKEETIDYVRCMTLNRNIDPNVYLFLSNSNIEQINNYIEAPMTATWFNEKQTCKKNSEQVTSELIYYYMVAFNIPFECEKWHINRLMTLIHICDIKNRPAKKMSKREIMSQNAALNAARRKRMNTKG